MLNLEIGLDRITVDVGLNAEEGAIIDAELSDRVEVCALRVRSKDKRETVFWFLNPEQVDEVIDVLGQWQLQRAAMIAGQDRLSAERAAAEREYLERR